MEIEFLERIITKYNLKNALSYCPYWVIPQAIINKELKILKEEINKQMENQCKK